MEPESWVFVIFIILSMNVGTLKLYLLLIILLVGAVYLINQQLINSIWLSFIGVYLLRQSKLFVRPHVVPESFMELGLRQPETVFFIAFADALLILLIFLLVRRRFRIKDKSFKLISSFPHILLLAMLLIGAIASWFSPLPEVSWFWLLQLGKLFTMAFLAMVLTQDRVMAKKTLEVIFIYGLFLASLVVLQKMNGGPIGLAIEERYTQYAGRFADESPGLYRPGGIFWDANLASSILIMFLPSWLIFSLKKGWFNQGFMMACFFIGSLALILTASRAAWVIGALLIMMSYQFVIKKIKVTFPTWIKKYGWIAALLSIVLLMPMVLTRLVSLGQVLQKDGGAVYRLRHLQMAIYFLITRPFGLGINVFQYEILNHWSPKFYLYDSTPAHNLFAQVGAAFGVSGLLVFIKFVFTLLKQGHQWLMSKQNILTKGLIIGCFGYLLASQFYPWWLTIPISGIVWVLLGTAYAQSKKN